MSRRKKQTIKIKVEVGRVSIGHQAHTSGSGVHDPRPRRTRTRQAQRRAWQREY